MRPLLLFSLLAFLLGACTTYPRYFDTDEPLRQAALTLTDDYLRSQIEQKEGTYAVMGRYGPGAVTIDLVRRYEIKGTDYDLAGHPVVFAWLEIGNEGAGIVESRYTVVLRYSRKLRDSGDKYLGLRVIEMRKMR